ncbi:MAG TPA: methyltransferase domain-containing protein [Vicinamibacterales bacterium]|nr:methyltransferase domain-containing protein [Vicinamibacterales bacterium]
MTSPNTKQAEKEYLARTGSSAWERSKPFSPPGLDTLAESARMLHDFAAALLVLEPAAGDRILDLGAGACWCSDLLSRLNRPAISVDISLDMLRAGRSRPGTSIRAAAGDMEALPFRAGTFQQAICLSAIHHVPDIPKAIREISRVLDDDGMALFSEPGRGHADAAVSTAAVRDFGVLEQEILIGPFIHHCREAGFEHVTVKPLLQSVPGFDLTLDQWESWSRLAASTRPRRALAKLAFAAAELVGLGKQGPLFEETLAVHMVRTVRQVVEHHPVIVAAKRRQATFAGPQWRASIRVQPLEPVARGRAVTMTVTATNTGAATWRARSASGIGHVTLGVQLLDAEERLVTRDYHRVALPHDVAPGQAVALSFECPVPPEPGRYGMKLDFVAEGITWFETVGSTPASLTLGVV